MMVNPYVAGGVALLIIVMGWQLKSSISRNGELETLLENQVSETEECVAANSSNSTTITDLQALIDDMIEGRRVEAAERERILVEREAEVLRWRARAGQLERERNNEIVTNEQCLEFNSLDPSRFCPQSASQLRLRSRGQNSDGDTDREGAGGGLQGSAGDPD